MYEIFVLLIVNFWFDMFLFILMLSKVNLIDYMNKIRYKIRKKNVCNSYGCMYIGRYDWGYLIVENYFKFVLKLKWK